jgi:hypothetical protein
MGAIRHFVEWQRKFGCRESAQIHLALFAAMPIRQFEPNQAEGKVGPGPCLNKTIDVRRQLGFAVPTTAEE